MSKKHRFRKFVQHLLKLFWASSTDSENITSSTYCTDSHKSDSYDRSMVLRGQNILSDIFWKRQSLFFKLIQFHILLKISCTFFLCQNILTPILTKKLFFSFLTLTFKQFVQGLQWTTQLSSLSLQPMRRRLLTPFSKISFSFETLKPASRSHLFSFHSVTKLWDEILKISKTTLKVWKISMMSSLIFSAPVC